MNWLDWLVLALLIMAAFKGFQRGLLIELASLGALVLGIWAGIHFSDRVADTIGLDPDRTAIAFLVTLVATLVAIHLLARALTKLIDLAQLGIPNKLAGVGFGMLRSAFVLSILLNLVIGWSDGRTPTRTVREGSILHAPLRGFAPFVLPVLGETKWVQQLLEQLQEETRELLNGRP